MTFREEVRSLDLPRANMMLISDVGIVCVRLND